MISGTFTADFSKFNDAVKQAEVTLKTFEEGANKVPKSLERIGNSLQGTKLIKDATMMAEQVERLGGVAILTDKELQRLGAQAAEAAEKMQKLGIKVPENLQAVATAAKQAADATEKIQGDALKNITAAASPASAALNSFGKEILGVASGFVSAQAVIGVVSGYFSTLTGFVADSVKAFGAAEAAQVKLTAAMKAQGTATPGTIDGFNDLATQFQQTTVYSDDLITSMEALLVQVGDVMPQDMEKALKAATDLASGLGIDLETATTLVAKAAAGHTETLGRYGITVDQAKLKTEGFSAVLTAINDQFGGQAAAQVDTYTGSVAQMANAWDNVHEALGKLIVQDPLVEKLLQQIAKWANEADKSSTGFSGSLIDLVAATGLLPSALTDVLDFYEKVARAERDLAKQNKEIAEYFRLLAKLQGGLSVFPSTIEGTGIPPEERAKLEARAAEDRKKTAKELADFQARLDEDTAIRQEHIYAEIKKDFDDMMKHQMEKLKAVNQATVDLVAAFTRIRDVEHQAFGPTIAFMQGIEQVGQKATVSKDEIKAWIDMAEFVGPTLEQAHPPIDTWKVFGEGVSDVSKAFGELAQISDGTFGGVVQDVGQVIGSVNVLQTAMKSMTDAVAAAGSGWQGYAAAATSSLAVVATGVGLLFDYMNKKNAQEAAVAAEWWKDYENVANRLQSLQDNFAIPTDQIDALKAKIESLYSLPHQSQFDLNAIRAYSAELDKMLGHFETLSKEASSRFGPSKAELEATARDAADVLAFMQNATTTTVNKITGEVITTSQFTADQIAQATVAAQTALAATGDIAAQAWVKAHDAVTKAGTELNKTLDDLTQRRDDLWKQVSQEAPEEVMGVIETAQRAQLGVLDDQIAAQKKAIEQQAKDAAEALERALSGIKPDTIHVPVVFDVNNIPNDWTRGGTPQPVPQARGGDWLVTKPTLFLAGEAGPERATFTPRGSAAPTEAAVSNRELELAALSAAIARLPRTISRAIRDGLVGMNG